MHLKKSRMKKRINFLKKKKKKKKTFKIYIYKNYHSSYKINFSQ